jgi:hypothetical protein
VNPTPRQGIRLRACPMRRLLLATLLLLVLLPAAGAFAADRPQDLLVDACRDERVDGTYSQRTFRRALDQLPADSDQYTACRDVINRARLAALNARRSQQSDDSGGSGTTSSTGGGGGSTGSSGGGGGGSAPVTPSTDPGGCQGCKGSGTALDTATPAEQRRVRDAANAGGAPVRVGGELLTPGRVGSLSNGRRDLPTPVIALLIALAACTLLGLAAVGWTRVNRVLARRPG